MANYCGQCGTYLDKETGLCPKCDQEKLQIMQKYSQRKRRKLKKSKNNKRRLTKGNQLLFIVVVALLLSLTVGIAWKFCADVKQDSLKRALQNSVQVMEMEVKMDSPHEGSAIIEIQMPNYETLFLGAVSASDPDQYLLNALKSGNYEIQTIEETARITVVDGKRQIHSEEVISRVLETNLIEAINAVTEVLGHEENY